MGEYYLLSVGGNDYILDDNLRVWLMRYMVGDVEEIPGLSFGPPSSTMPTDSDWSSLCAGLPRDGLKLTPAAHSSLESAYPGLVDKMDALCEAMHLTPVLSAFDEAFEVAKVKKFHEKGDEKLVVESWNNLREILLRERGRFDLDYLNLLWACDRPHILEKLLAKYGTENPAKVGTQAAAKEKKEDSKRSCWGTYSESELANIIFNETRSVIPGPQGTREHLFKDRVEIGKIVLMYPTKKHAPHELINMREEETPILEDCRRAAKRAKAELSSGKESEYGHFVVHNDKYEDKQFDDKLEEYKYNLGYKHRIKNEETGEIATKYHNPATPGRKTVYLDSRITKNKDIPPDEKAKYPTTIMFFYNASKEKPKEESQ